MELPYRTSCRGQVTKVVNGITEFLRENRPSENDAYYDELNVLLARMKLAHENLQKANVAVRDKIKVEDYEKESDAIIEYEDKAVGTIVRLERLITTEKAPSANADNIAANMSVSNLKVQNTVRLPKLDLKKFSGKYDEWIPFWEQFQTAVHTNHSLNEASKFNYLQSVLVGQAASVISGLTPTQICYNQAIEMLKEEFGDKEKLTEKYIQQLMSIQIISGEDDVKGLRQLYNTVSSAIRSLTALGISLNSYDLMLRSIILKSLPNSLRVDFHRGDSENKRFNGLSNEEGNEEATDAHSVSSVSLSDTSESEVQKILKFIKREVSALEKAVVERKERRLMKVGNVNPLSRVSTAAGLFTAEFIETCLFCGSKQHATRNCDGPHTLDQKKSILKREGRCFRCTRKNHSAKFCKAKWLKCSKCRGRHVASMCDPEFRRKYDSSTNKIQDKKQSSISTGSIDKAVNLYTSHKKGSNILLQTARAIAYSSDDTAQLLRMVIDGGSQVTFIKSDVSRKLNLPIIGKKLLSIIPFGADNPSCAEKYNQVKLTLYNQYNNQCIELEAIEVPQICVDVLPISNLTIRAVKELELADLNIKDGISLDGISVLVGADNYWRLVTGETRRLSNRLVAINTKLGWTLHGMASEKELNEHNKIISLFTCDSLEQIDISNFWRLELLGIEVDKANSNNFTEQFSKHAIVLKGNRYEVKLPWKDSKVNLDNNRNGALIRMKNLTRRLIKSPSKLLEYDGAIQDLLSKGMAEMVSEKDSMTDRIYYMPHKPVYREDKTTSKLRVVFDASAKEPGLTSLNDNLLQGDNLLPEIFVILLNFRLKQVALIADIEQAFLQISLSQEERNSHRFFWYSKKLKTVTELPEVAEYRMCRVTFGVTSSPFLLAATIKKHLRTYCTNHKESCEKMMKSFYVDDLVTSTDDFSSAYYLYQEANLIMGKASMKLRKWNTNNHKLREILLTDANSAQATNYPKVLGMNWCTISDEISVDLQGVNEFVFSASCTKRSVLQTISRVFDPLGMLGPFTVRLKILLQNIWKLKPGWDDNLAVEIQTTWRAWCNELKDLETFYIPRCIFPSGEEKDIELHIFADASPKAYGAVAYLRGASEEGQAFVNFLSSKNRVAPLKDISNSELTLPKLELTAALVAARLKSHLLKTLNLKLNGVCMWTDSKITLSWIQGDSKKWKPYVANRIQEIQQLTNVYDWKYCPGKTNPADFLTRGIQANYLANSMMWLHGPVWLQQKKSEWPSDEYDYNMSEESTQVLMVESGDMDAESIHLKPLLILHKYSSLQRLLNVTAFVFRFLNSIRKKNKETGPLSYDELNNAEVYWIKHFQGEFYANEISSIKRRKSISNKSKILSLSPYLDEDNILRVGGRMQLLEDNTDMIHPIILPKQAYLSELIIRNAHKITLHAGVNLVLAKVRGRFWIVKARQLIKTIIGRCVHCRKLRGKTASEPFAPLPKERMLATRPFETTGVDFAGPLYIKSSTDDTKREKTYIMLLTCAVTRAVHLELVLSLTAESCLGALRRFISRRGIPKVIYSDNAKTFKRSSLEIETLQRCLNENGVREYGSHQGIKWKFIIERAAWWGGFWERLVKSIKDALKAAIFKSTLNIENMWTVLTEVEAVINSRPLTYITDHPNDLQPLTPAHFLTGSDVSTTIGEAAAIGTSGNQVIIGLWKSRQKASNLFWKRWKNEYFQHLRAAHHNTNSLSSNLQVGDVVLLKDDKQPRILWKLGVIERSLIGRDGKVRACEVRLSNQTTMRRPVQLLCPLEIHEKNSPGGEDVENIPNSEN